VGGRLGRGGTKFSLKERRSECSYRKKKNGGGEGEGERSKLENNKGRDGDKNVQKVGRGRRNRITPREKKGTEDDVICARIGD